MRYGEAKRIWDAYQKEAHESSAPDEEWQAFTDRRISEIRAAMAARPKIDYGDLMLEHIEWLRERQNSDRAIEILWLHLCKGVSLNEIALDFGISRSAVEAGVDRFMRRIDHDFKAKGSMDDRLLPSRHSLADLQKPLDDAALMRAVRQCLIARGVGRDAVRATLQRLCGPCVTPEPSTSTYWPA